MRLFSVEIDLRYDVLEKDKWKEVDDGWIYILHIEGIEKYPDSFIEFDTKEEISIEGYENELELFCEKLPEEDIPIRIFIMNWGN